MRAMPVHENQGWTQPALVCITCYHPNFGLIHEVYTADEYPRQAELEEMKVEACCRFMNLSPENEDYSRGRGAIAAAIDSGTIISSADCQLVSDIPPFVQPEFNVLESVLLPAMALVIPGPTLLNYERVLTQATASGMISPVIRQNHELVEQEMLRRLGAESNELGPEPGENTGS